MPIEFVPAVCPNCGGELRVPKDRESIKCMYCGCDIIMHKTQTDSPQPSVKNWLILADAAIGSNNKEAYIYYAKVLEVEPENWKALYGKAIAAGWQSTLFDPKFNELLQGVQKAIQFVPDDEKVSLQLRIIDQIVSLAENFQQQADKYLLDNAEVRNIFDDYSSYCKLVLTLVDFAITLIPNNLIVEDYQEVTQLYLLGISVSKSLLEGHYYINNETAHYNLGHLDEGSKPIVMGWFNQYVEKLKEIHPSFHPPIIQEKKRTSCFIATATMGRSDDTSVITLCEFRDRILMKTVMGRIFVNFYYRYSPPVAQLIKCSNFLKRVSLLLIIYPCVFIVKLLDGVVINE